MAAANGYSHTWTDFQEIIAEAGRHGFRHSKFPCFVETGTFLGQTVIPLAHHFQEVHTIEAKEECFEAAKLSAWKAKGPIHFHRGASQQVLPAIAGRLKRPTIFYLDAHFSGGLSGGDPSDVPLRHELEAINRHFKRHSAIVVIDDLRLFGREHNFDHISGQIADWREVTEAALCGCLTAERLACTFAMPAKDCLVLCLRPSDSLFEPPPGHSFQLAKGSRCWGKAHWVSEPGLPMDTEALKALHARAKGWDQVATALSLEYSNAHQKSGAGFRAITDAVAEAADADQGRPAPKVVLTRQQAMDMQLELVDCFEAEEFRDELLAAWDAAGGDLFRQMEARMKVCLKVQAEVIPKYGFEPTRRGVAQSVYTVRALFMEDADVMMVAARLCELVDPPRLRQS